MRSREAVISAQATAPASAPRISRIVLAYAVTSVIWIATSDQLVEFLFSDRAAATEISIGKGVLFVVLTSWLLYALLRRYQYQMERAYEERFGTLMLLEAISESCTDAIYAKTLDGRYTFANQAVASILGVPLSEIVGKMDADLFPSAEAARIARSDQAIIGQGTPITVTEVLPTPTGPRIFDTTKGRLMKKEGRWPAYSAFHATRPREWPQPKACRTRPWSWLQRFAPFPTSCSRLTKSVCTGKFGHEIRACSSMNASDCSERTRTMCCRGGRLKL